MCGREQVNSEGVGREEAMDLEASNEDGEAIVWKLEGQG